MNFFTNNPFYILGIPLESDREKIISVCDDKSFFDDETDYDTYRDFLLSPMKRIKYEWTWFINFNEEIIDDINKENEISVPFNEDYIDYLTINLYNLSIVKERSKIIFYIKKIIEGIEKINKKNIGKLLNIYRSKAGFTELNINQINDACSYLQDISIECVKNKLNETDNKKVLAEEYFNIIKYCVNNDFVGPIVYELLETYEKEYFHIIEEIYNNIDFNFQINGGLSQFKTDIKSFLLYSSPLFYSEKILKKKINIILDFNYKIEEKLNYLLFENNTNKCDVKAGIKLGEYIKNECSIINSNDNFSHIFKEIERYKNNIDIEIFNNICNKYKIESIIMYYLNSFWNSNIDEENKECILEKFRESTLERFKETNLKNGIETLNYISTDGNITDFCNNLFLNEYINLYEKYACKNIDKNIEKIKYYIQKEELCQEGHNLRNIFTLSTKIIYFYKPLFNYKNYNIKFEKIDELKSILLELANFYSKGDGFERKLKRLINYMKEKFAFDSEFVNSFSLDIEKEFENTSFYIQYNELISIDKETFNIYNNFVSYVIKYLTFTNKYTIENIVEEINKNKNPKIMENCIPEDIKSLFNSTKSALHEAFVNDWNYYYNFNKPVFMRVYLNYLKIKKLIGKKEYLDKVFFDYVDEIRDKILLLQEIIYNKINFLKCSNNVPKYIEEYNSMVVFTKELENIYRPYAYGVYLGYKEVLPNFREIFGKVEEFLYFLRKDNEKLAFELYKYFENLPKEYYPSNAWDCFTWDFLYLKKKFEGKINVEKEFVDFDEILSEIEKTDFDKDILVSVKLFNKIYEKIDLLNNEENIKLKEKIFFAIKEKFISMKYKKKFLFEINIKFIGEEIYNLLINLYDEIIKNDLCIIEKNILDMENFVQNKNFEGNIKEEILKWKNLTEPVINNHKEFLNNLVKFIEKLILKSKYSKKGERIGNFLNEIFDVKIKIYKKKVFGMFWRK